MRKIRWGVLGAAKIAVEKVIPAMQRGQTCEVVALASRSIDKARTAADRLGIPTAYGSYEELLADPNVEAVYNPLPNHLHVPWSIRAAEAGKHVLCEKPIALDAAEARALVAARDAHRVLIQEAFMVRTHPQWLGVRSLIGGGRIGDLCAIQTIFSYHNRNPADVRNMAGIGGGGIYDIGCYAITTSRFLFGEEPRRVVASIERDPVMKIDRLASAILDFPKGQSVFVCGTQLVPHQRTQLLGTRGRIEIEIPFNIPVDRPCTVVVDDGRDVHGGGRETISFEAADSYTIQGDLFSQAIVLGQPAPIPLEDAVKNMQVIDALFRSAANGRWETP